MYLRVQAVDACQLWVAMSEIRSLNNHFQAVSAHAKLLSGIVRTSEVLLGVQSRTLSAGS